MAEFINLDNTKAAFFYADQQSQLKVTNTSNVTLYYDDTSAVSSGTNDGNLTQGQNNTFTTGFYLRPASQCQVIVEHLVGAASQDLTLGDDLVVGDALTVAGITTTTGGVSSGTAGMKRFGNRIIYATTDGTNATPSITVVYMSQIFIPYNVTLTGAATFNGTDVTDKTILALFNSSGTALANTATAGTQQTGTDAWQAIDFTATKAVTGPATYWIGQYFNGTTSRFNALPALSLHSVGLCGSVSAQTFGTVANVTLPTTTTADLGPYCYVY